MLPRLRKKSKLIKDIIENPQGIWIQKTNDIMNKHELNEEDIKGTKYTSKKKIEQKNKRSFKQRITQSSA